MAQDYYEITTPATEQPILFAAAQSWGRDIDSADSAIVNTLIEAATNLFQSITNRVFITTSFTGKFAEICYSSYEPYQFVEIRRSPLIAISEIRINGDIVASTNYEIKKSNGFSRVLFTEEISLDEGAFPIEIDFTAGYGSSANVPSDIITALEQWVLYLYENRGDVAPDSKQQIPFVSKQIMKKYRIVNTYG